MIENKSPLMTDRQVADFLQCSRGTVWRLTAQGALPAPVRIAGMTRWRRDDIATLAAQPEAAE
jgi:predicted DNA-binding transcriptional regulator AlpA